MKYVFAAYNYDIDPMDDPFHPFTPDEWSQDVQNMGPNLFAHNEIITHNMCETWGRIYLHAKRTCLCHATCYCMCSDVIHALCGARTQASQPPLCKCGMSKIPYGHAICTS